MFQAALIFPANLHFFHVLYVSKCHHHYSQKHLDLNQVFPFSVTPKHPPSPHSTSVSSDHHYSPRIPIPPLPTTISKLSPEMQSRSFWNASLIMSVHSLKFLHGCLLSLKESLNFLMWFSKSSSSFSFHACLVHTTTQPSCLLLLHCVCPLLCRAVSRAWNTIAWLLFWLGPSKSLGLSLSSFPLVRVK